MSINKVIIKRLQKLGEVAFLSYTLTAPMAGVAMPPEVAMGRMAKCHAVSIESTRSLRKRQEDILSFVLSPKPSAGD